VAQQEQFYREEDAQEIFRMAARQQSGVDESGESRISSLELERSAQEIGISPEALRLAKEEHAQQRETDLLRQQFIRSNREGFQGHLLVYVLVNLFLAFLSLSKGQFWFLFSVFGWGIPIAIQAYHALRTSGPGFETAFQNWRDALNARPIDTSHDEMLRTYCDELALSGAFINKMETIRWFREKTGLPLKDSVEVVDSFARRNPGYFIL